MQSEIEFLQSASRQSGYQDETYKANYEKTLERLNALTAENQELRRQLDDSRYQLQSFSARFEALERAKNREIEELKLNFSQYSKESYENALSAIRLQSEGEVRRVELEVKRMRELN
jgi:peptidoglycan hydrolase CwlO-like protein